MSLGGWDILLGMLVVVLAVLLILWVGPPKGKPYKPVHDCRKRGCS